MCVERGLVYVISMHPHLVVAQAEIKLGEEGHTAELVEWLFNDGDGELILDGAAIEGVIIDIEVPSVIALLDQ
jgi:hypothetical protein